jgi:hypothetical protein
MWRPQKKRSFVNFLDLPARIGPHLHHPRSIPSKPQNVILLEYFLLVIETLVQIGRQLGKAERNQ